MSMNDVWRDISKYINVYTSENFDDVPSKPGVYAWYYPIKVPSKDISDLSLELASILDYDSAIQDSVSGSADVKFNWKTTKVKISEESNVKLKPSSKKTWGELIPDEELYVDFRKVLLASSILMPPLYIGKTNNLLRRCIEHRKGSGSSEDKNEFHTRFEEYTKTKILENGKNFYTNEVEDLIFVCIRASASSLDDNKENGIEELLENILQVIAKPPYSRK
jgi:hypothetical protein